jgi:isoquinoline 1-oxidoreductase subunit alpha
MVFDLRINGAGYSVDTEEDTPLLWVLRDLLGMTGTKFGCGMAMCGACTVHANGSPIRSCVLAIKDVGNVEITTIEGIGATDLGKKVQEAWLALDVPQCGYCQGGQILAATALLANSPAPTDADIDAAMAGNICRCGTYLRIRAAIKQVSDSLKS